MIRLRILIYSLAVSLILTTSVQAANFRIVSNQGQINLSIQTDENVVGAPIVYFKECDDHFENCSPLEWGGAVVGEEGYHPQKILNISKQLALKENASDAVYFTVLGTAVVFAGAIGATLGGMFGAALGLILTAVKAGKLRSAAKGGVEVVDAVDGLDDFPMGPARQREIAIGDPDRGPSLNVEGVIDLGEDGQLRRDADGNVEFVEEPTGPSASIELEDNEPKPMSEAELKYLVSEFKKKMKIPFVTGAANGSLFAWLAGVTFSRNPNQSRDNRTYSDFFGDVAQNYESEGEVFTFVIRRELSTDQLRTEIVESLMRVQP